MSDINNQLEQLQEQVHQELDHLRDWVISEIDWIEMDLRVDLNQAYKVLGGLYENLS